MPFAFRFSKPIKFLNRTGFNWSGLESLVARTRSDQALHHIYAEHKCILKITIFAFTDLVEQFIQLDGKRTTDNHLKYKK